MKIVKIGDPKVIISNRDSYHNYFAWPTVAKLQNGKVAVVASGFRLKHVCPFGKAVIAYSENNGETYTAPAPIIDTLLDDRDAGILAFGESGVIVTSFNNTVEFQMSEKDKYGGDKGGYQVSYLNRVESEQEAKYLGATFKMSDDCGVTFGPVLKSPVTSPHGPLVTQDGRIIWVGRNFADRSRGVEAYEIRLDGSMEFVGAIPDCVYDDKKVMSVEPYAIELDDGTLLCQIRVGRYGDDMVLTTYQSESTDGGKTWSTPRPLLSKNGGATAHIIKHSSGVLISAYEKRRDPADEESPYGIKVMLSRDNGRTWDTDNWLYETRVSTDLGYPATIELEDGSLLTVFYAHEAEDSPAEIFQQKWKLEL